MFLRWSQRPLVDHHTGPVKRNEVLSVLIPSTWWLCARLYWRVWSMWKARFYSWHIYIHKQYANAMCGAARCWLGWCHVRVFVPHIPAIVFLMLRNAWMLFELLGIAFVLAITHSSAPPLLGMRCGGRYINALVWLDWFWAVEQNNNASAVCAFFVRRPDDMKIPLGIETKRGVPRLNNNKRN